MGPLDSSVGLRRPTLLRPGRQGPETSHHEHGRPHRHDDVHILHVQRHRGDRRDDPATAHLPADVLRHASHAAGLHQPRQVAGAHRQGENVGGALEAAVVEGDGRRAGHVGEERGN